MIHLVALLPSLLALISAFTVVTLGLWLSGFSASAVFSALLSGAGGDAYRLSETFVKTCPLLYTGLAVSFTLHVGLWNIGAEGQFLLGALTAAWVGQYTSTLPHSLGVLLLCCAAMCGGGLWATCAAMLKNKRGVNEVISTIMLNFIAAGLVSYCVHGPLMEKGAQYPQTDPLPPTAQLPRLLPPTRLHLGIVIALLAAICVHIFLFRTKAGLRLRITGANVVAARFAGISTECQISLAFAVSGALAGLAGGVEVSGVTQRVYEKFSPGYGYTAIAVALVAQRSPLGVIFAATFFGALEAGSGAMQRSAGISSVLVSVIQAIVVFFLAAYSTQPVQTFLNEKLQRITTLGLFALFSFPASPHSFIAMGILSILISNSEALLHATLVATTPLLLAALGETLTQRAGVINIGLEGLLLCGAFAGMVGSYFTGSPLIGLFLGGMSGVLLAMLFAFITVGLAANQIVAGVSINLFASGVTGVLYRGLFGVTGQALVVASFTPAPIPLLSDLPFFGPAFFQHTLLVYLSIFLVPFFNFFLFHTRGGLQLQAVGEYPQAAETLGISVYWTRISTILVEGFLGGLAGSYLSLAYANTFIEGMSAGRGFIALAIVIFGRWKPYGVLAAALFFGCATALQFHLQALGSILPYQFVLILPYLLTLLALAFTGTKLSAPSALGETYNRE